MGYICSRLMQAIVLPFTSSLFRVVGVLILYSAFLVIRVLPGFSGVRWITSAGSKTG